MSESELESCLSFKPLAEKCYRQKVKRIWHLADAGVLCVSPFGSQGTNAQHTHGSGVCSCTGLTMHTHCLRVQPHPEAYPCWGRSAAISSEELLTPPRHLASVAWVSSEIRTCFLRKVSGEMK